jgi:hypothetical protein
MRKKLLVIYSFTFFCWDCDLRMACSRRESQAGSLQFGFQIAEMSQHISSQLPELPFFGPLECDQTIHARRAQRDVATPQWLSSR